MVYFLGLVVFLWLVGITVTLTRILEKLRDIRYAISDLGVPKLSTLRQKAESESQKYQAEREARVEHETQTENEALAARARILRETPEG